MMKNVDIKSIKITQERDETCKPVHIDGVYCISNDVFGQILIYYDEPVVELTDREELIVSSITRHLIGDLRMSPLVFKKIADALNQNIKTEKEDSI